MEDAEAYALIISIFSLRFGFWCVRVCVLETAQRNVCATVRKLFWLAPRCDRILHFCAIHSMYPLRKCIYIYLYLYIIISRRRRSESYILIV